MQNRNRILVVGATGQQGGAVARVLLAEGWLVRGFTRDINSAAAQELKTIGVEMRQGNLADRASVDQAMEEVYGVFNVHPGPLAMDQDEVQAGKNVADAAVAHQVAHLVYSSAIGVDQAAQTGMQTEKAMVEKYIQTLGISYTILRPASFMENFVHPAFGLQGTSFTTAALPSTQMQLIALEDIGQLAAIAFRQREAFNHKIIELSGDTLTPVQMAAAMSKTTGLNIQYQLLPMETLRQLNPRFARGYEWLNSGKTTKADEESLRKIHPGLLTFEEWLNKKGAKKIMNEALRLLNK
ncbi:NmrA/HSCARG family protein [Chitinophaga polysaccharea]|uniref:NmrA/HSCARG family protein n=1 Tax=Chitinophaga polysaccharea TaxID=1293035 RepID=UPI001454E4D6|nr:NmrA/HSCARG family protein [Chitinophaga polysaccharea]NLR60371.1 NmrA/HSCARG family protein [Chitinophaga polysaccharea]